MIDPEKTYKDLMSEAAGDRTKKSLTAIHNVCKQQRERGSSDFSIATISKVGEETGVPRAQSIRNKSGAQYKELITAWQLSNPSKIKKVSSDKLEWLDKIDDATTRFFVNDLMADLSKAKAELALLKSIKKLNIDMRGESVSAQSIRDQSAIPEFLSSEIESLRNAIDESNLRKRGWSITEKRGAVVDERGKVIFKNGFVTAIQKMLTVNK